MTNATKTRPAALALVALMLAPAAQAHDLWVNAHAGQDGAQSIVVTSIGWGHTPLPLSEFLPGDRISAYALVGPDGSRFDLPVDPAANASVNQPVEGLAGLARLQSGDAMMRRVVLDAAAASGGWRVHVANPARVRTTWIDADGVQRSGARFADEIADAREIVSTAVSQRDATAWWTHGAWSAPAPSDATFEILPGADPSALRAGDTLPVSVVLNGAPLDPGQFALFAGFGAGEMEPVILETGIGAAEYTLPRAGYWLLRAALEVPVAEAGPEYAAFEGRIDSIRFIATLAIQVAPGGES